MHKFNNSYYYFGIWISTSSIKIIIISKSKPSFWLSTSSLRVIVVSKSKPSFWLSTSLLTVITISEFELAQVQ